MRVVIVFVILLAGCGCAEPPQPVYVFTSADSPAPISVPEKQLTDEEKFKLLDARSKEKKVRYIIFCASAGDWKFQADAKVWDEPPGAIYVEDGAKPWWAGTGNTPADAAYSLYLDLAGDADLPVSHAPTTKMKNGELCPPEIHGGYSAKETNP